MGAVLDGCPAGIPFDGDYLSRYLARRRPGQSSVSSPRTEPDRPEILSGVFDGKTLGTPIAVLVRNKDARSEDYDTDMYRPGHADRTWEDKYGIRDYRGGGRASGRETVSRIIGGAIAEKILPPDFSAVAFTHSIGGIETPGIPDQLTREVVDSFPTRCPDQETDNAIQAELRSCKQTGDSLGGLAEIRIGGVPSGLGEPVFRKAKSELAAGLMSIGAVTGVTLGPSFDESKLRGLDYYSDTIEEGIAVRSYGIQGGTTTGHRITLLVHVKPSATVGTRAVQGRHDPCIVPRIVPVLEAMCSLVLADLYLISKIDRHGV